uniref:Uncharacterized protein n=1 Tax=Rangifer tarandus platyrhynchus TaxID=3082113 RepID=A0ACB0FLU3_RANTA|nr:unnamed protein product [Rangifer tarandus platyrhynchus]
MELQWQSPEPGKKWEQEEDQEKAGPEDQDGLHIKKRPQSQAIPRRCPGGSLRWEKSLLHLPEILTNACGPGGRGAEGRGDIIRAAPPPAATFPQAPRSIHDIIGLISTPFIPGIPAVGRSPSPAPGPTERASRCSGQGERSESRGARRWVCLTYSLPQGPARGLQRWRRRPGSLARPEARPAGREARARLRSAPLPLPARAPPTRCCGKRRSALQPRPPSSPIPGLRRGPVP